MLCATNSSSPPSPAGSEISVGAPSPPPPKLQHHPENERRRNGDDYFQPLKRLKGIQSARERSASPPPPTQRSTLEGVKSFSIADILGHETNSNNNNNSTTASNQHQTTVSRAQLNFGLFKEETSIEMNIQMCNIVLCICFAQFST